jgi:hypothetical protein
MLGLSVFGEGLGKGEAFVLEVAARPAGPFGVRVTCPAR